MSSCTSTAATRRGSPSVRASARRASRSSTRRPRGCSTRRSGRRDHPCRADGPRGPSSPPTACPGRSTPTGPAGPSTLPRPAAPSIAPTLWSSAASSPASASSTARVTPPRRAAGSSALTAPAGPPDQRAGVAGVRTLEAANAYLREQFLPDYHAHLPRLPADPARALVRVGAAVDLDQSSSPRTASGWWGATMS